MYVVGKDPRMAAFMGLPGQDWGSSGFGVRGFCRGGLVTVI